MLIVNDEQLIISKLAGYGITKQNDVVTLALWGSGNPRREFLYVDDMADACLFVMQNVDFADLVTDKKEIRNTHINIGTGEDITIRDLADLIKDQIGFNGRIEFDSTKPDGTIRKLQDVSRLKELGWTSGVSLIGGIYKVLLDYGIN